MSLVDIEEVTLLTPADVVAMIASATEDTRRRLSLAERRIGELETEVRTLVAIRTAAGTVWVAGRRMEIADRDGNVREVQAGDALPEVSAWDSGRQLRYEQQGWIRLTAATDAAPAAEPKRRGRPPGSTAKPAATPAAPTAVPTSATPSLAEREAALAAAAAQAERDEQRRQAIESGAVGEATDARPSDPPGTDASPSAESYSPPGD